MPEALTRDRRSRTARNGRILIGMLAGFRSERWPASNRKRGRHHVGIRSHKACRDDRSVLYQRVPKLFASLALARGDGRHARFLAKLGSVQLLILDDWGLEPLDARARHDLLEILEERYGRRSTIITSQLPVTAWHEVIGDQTYADAILDRLVHNAHRLDLDSMRRTKTRPQA